MHGMNIRNKGGKEGNAASKEVLKEDARNKYRNLSKKEKKYKKV